MSSVKLIEPPGAGGGSVAGLEPISSAADLIAAMDARTQSLLARGRSERRARLVPRSLLLADMVGLGIAYLLATKLVGGNGAFGSSQESLVFVLTLPCWVLVAKLHGLYARDQQLTDHSTTNEVVGIFHLVTVGVWILLVASRLAGRSGPGVYALIAFWALAVCILPVTRTIAREACKRCRAYVQNAVIVGAGEVGQLIGRKLLRHPEYGVNLVGFVDQEPKIRRADLPEHITILGPPDRLPEIVECLAVERVVVAFSRESVPDMLDVVRRLRGLPVHIDLVPRLFELLDPRVELDTVEGIPLLGLPPLRSTTSARTLKRALDLVGATAALIALAPLWVYIAIRIRLDSEGPILFRQTRLGRGMKEFTVLKFRTMAVGTDPSTHEAYIRATMSPTAHALETGVYKLDRRESVTGFGSWLRRTSLDELPQLLNVLRGEMSLVGPRPCIPYEVENYQPHHFERFSVPPGITGLWQVTARANSTYGEALEMDVAYARGWSFGLDLRLLLRTPLQVCHQRTSTA